MFEHGFFIKIPNEIELIGFALIGLMMIVGAIAIEIYRRRREKRLVREAELRAVDQIAREKELPERERRFLKAFIRTHGWDSPLRTITTRIEFERCIEAEMDDLEAAGDFDALEERGILLRDIRICLGLDYIPIGQRIHSTRELYHDQTLWASNMDGGAGDWHRMYITSVDEAHFRIAPRDIANAPRFRENTEIRFRLWRENDARYVFSAMLVRIAEKPLQYMLRHATELKRIQSRAWYRLPYEKTLPIQVLNAPLDGAIPESEDQTVTTTLRGRFVNISGGGFAAVITQPLPKQVILRTTLELESEDDLVTITARPVHADSISSGRYLLRAAFAGISDETRDIITRYITEAQQPRHEKESGVLEMHRE